MRDSLASTVTSLQRAIWAPWAAAPVLSTPVAASALVAGAAVGLSIIAHRILFSRNKALREQVGDMVPCTALPAAASGVAQHVLVTGPSAAPVTADGVPLPVVVLIHGFGCSSIEWGPVQAALSKTHRVISYDRVLYTAGQLRQPRSARVLVEELDELIAGVLGGAAAATPLLVVGHSYGGLIAQAFAMRYPGRVSGLVLVDPAHEGQWAALPADFVFAFRAVPWVFAGFRALAPLGLVRALSAVGLMSFPPLYLFDPVARRRAVELYSEAVVWDRVAAELTGCNVAFAEMAEYRRQLPLSDDLPIRLIIAGDRKYSPTLHPAGVTRGFLDLHAELLRRPRARLTIASHSDHWVHLQQPELVVEAAQELLRGEVVQEEPTCADAE